MRQRDTEADCGGLSVALPSQIPAKHRETALSFPSFERMTPAEAAYRAEYIDILLDKCPTTGELRDITLAYTDRLAAALPVPEYLAQLRHLYQMADQLPTTGI